MAKSIVVFYIEHGDDTDPLTQMIDNAFFAEGLSVENYELQVDVTEAQAEKALTTVLNLHSDQFAQNA